MALCSGSRAGHHEADSHLCLIVCFFSLPLHSQSATGWGGPSDLDWARGWHGVRDEGGGRLFHWARKQQQGGRGGTRCHSLVGEGSSTREKEEQEWGYSSEFSFASDYVRHACSEVLLLCVKRKAAFFTETRYVYIYVICSCLCAQLIFI